ncbi:MAG TPA: zf-HC2 domain-containing protein [Thermoanaerobaculia bacterium]|nr:zf-HC2 domain-containing protein [Thermoanaerobaculia bacterium]
MTCDQAIELLPWLLNGTLEAEERAEVRRHLQTCERCREALAETRMAGAMFSQHIPSQDMVALAWGETPSGIDAAAAEAHLASCPQCAAELELARMSRRLEEEANVAVFPAARPRTGAVEAPRTWRAMAVAASLLALVASSGWIYTAVQATDPAGIARAEQPAAPATVPVAPQAPSGEASSLRQKIAQMEGDMRRLIGLQQENDKKVADAQAQVAQLEKEREILARPQPADPVLFNEVVRDSEGGKETVVRADVYSALLLPARGATGKRSAEILDESGKVVFRVDGLTDKLEYYSLALPPRALRPGRYTVRISGQDEARAFQVVP